MDKINGGSFQIARKIFQSELWNDKPCSWKVIWFYILGKVSYKDSGKLKRGIGYFNFTAERSLIGKDISPDTIKKCLGYMRGSMMIRTTKSTRGMYIEVINYNVYQEMDNYKAPQKALEKHDRSTTEAPLYNKKEKKEKKEKNTISDVPSQDIVDVINSFKEVNPSYGKWFQNITQRESVKRLIRVHGKEKLLEVIAYLPQSNKIPFIPTATTPLQLEDKWAAIRDGLIKKKSELLSKQPIVHI